MVTNEELQKQILELKELILGQKKAPVITCKYSFYEWLDEWFTAYKKPKLKASTLEIIECCIKLHIKPYIENQLLSELTGLDVQKALNMLSDSRTKKITYDIYNASLKQALKLKLISENIMLAVESVNHKGKKGKALTIEQQQKFIKAIQKNKFKNLYMFYLLSGTRRNEALSLKWADVDYESGRILINGTKTDNAVRYIPLFEEIKILLKDMPEKNECVFPYSVNALKCNFKRLLKKLSFKFRLHDLRHTFATRCLENGISMNTVSKWLGHSRASVTSDIYTHVTTEFELMEVKRFDPKINDKK